MDILEIALDQLTDYIKFERLATEVLAVEGFSDIRPIGGIQDDGIDAELTRYYINETFKTVFQYSIQENISSKINATIKRLKQESIVFDELIIVTSNKVNTIQDLRKKARMDHQVRLEIFDREIFIKNLSVRNDIFLRHFPSIREQLTSSLFDKKSIFSLPSEEPLETSLLKCSLLFTFNPKSEIARKDLIDLTILAMVVNEKVSTISEIAAKFNDKFKKELQNGELEAILHRLKKKNLITVDSTGMNPTKPAIEKIEGNSRRINSETQALINEIVNNVQLYYSTAIDSKTQARIADNAKKSLSAYFSLYGLEYTDPAKTQSIRYGFTDNTDLISLAKASLPEKIGELTVLSIGEVLKKPSDEQAMTLANWAKAFIAVQIMGLDPKLTNFQATRLAKKTFIVDTDFLLYCIVDDCKISSTYIKILKHLKDLRCRIVIPEEVIYEAIKHAEFAERNYNYFKNTFESVDEMIVDQKVANVFVKGFYHCLLQNRFHGMTFKTYLGNFYEKELPYNFLKEVIQTKLPDIEIRQIEELFNKPIAHDKLEELIHTIQIETEKTFKSQYRSEDENREIAKTDALLFLAAYYLNQENGKDKSTLLSGSHYLITSSTRAQKCAKRLGYNDNVISKPQTIIALLDKLGEFKTSPTELVNLFENPYLVEVANNSWDDIKALVDVGVSLIGKNVVRLKWELDSEIKSFIEKQNLSIESEGDNPLSDYEDIDNFVDFVNKVKSKGYQLIPESEKLVSKYEELSNRISEKEKIEEAMLKEIEKFGRRRQHYFDKITKRQKRK